MKKNIYLNKAEYDFVDGQEPGYIRSLIQEKMESISTTSIPFSDRCSFCDFKLNVNQKCVNKACQNFLK